MADAPLYDVAVVGAGLAGCAAARLFAMRGLSVALVEQHAAFDWHKRMCTHYIQAGAVSAIQRLGLEPLIESAGGVRSRMEIWTRWGWIKHTPRTSPETYGYSIRRQTLDPLVRHLAADTEGVHLLLGHTVSDLLRDSGRVVGIVLQDARQTTSQVTARLVVAADGRDSLLAKLGQIRGSEKPNNRFACFAYYRNLPLLSGNDAQFWMLDPDAAYALPNDDDITLLCCWFTKDHWEAYRHDKLAYFEQFFRGLPRGPNIDGAERVSDVLGARDLPVRYRVAARPGLALVGDAALAADPLWGVGCGWAFQSAQWLVDGVAPALLERGDVDRALRQYAKQHRAALGGHHLMIADYARGRRFSLLEKLYYSAAAKDQVLADTILAFGARRIGVGSFLAPATLARAVFTRFRRKAREPLGSAPGQPAVERPSVEPHAPISR